MNQGVFYRMIGTFCNISFSLCRTFQIRFDEVLLDVLTRLHHFVICPVSLNSRHIIFLAVIAILLVGVINSVLFCLISITFLLPQLVVTFSRVSDRSYRWWMVGFVVNCVALQLHMGLLEMYSVQESYPECFLGQQWWCAMSWTWCGKFQGRVRAT